MKRRGTISAILTVLVSVLIAACGGGGDDSAPPPAAPPPPPVPNASAEGVWFGTATSSTGVVTNLILLSLASGETRVINVNTCAQLVGNVTSSGTNLNASVTGYAPDYCNGTISNSTFVNGSKVAPFTVTGTVATRTSISGTYTGGGETGTISLQYDAGSYERASSTAIVSGNYVSTVAGVFSGAIDANGSLLGSDASGTLNGTVLPVNSARNAYRVTVTYTPTNGDPPRAYTGLGTTADFQAGQTNDLMLLQLSNTTRQIYLLIRKT